MELASGAQALTLTLQVLFLDLLLSSDNALVIALACRSLPARQKRQAMLLGTGAAIGLRVVLTLVAAAVLQVPLLKLLGGLALLVIAVQLTTGDAPALEAGQSMAPMRSADNLSSVVGTIVLADLVMSTDNVVALAAVAQGSVSVLVAVLWRELLHIGEYNEFFTGEALFLPATPTGVVGILQLLACGAFLYYGPRLIERIPRESSNLG